MCNLRHYNKTCTHRLREVYQLSREKIKDWDWLISMLKKSTPHRFLLIYNILWHRDSYMAQLATISTRE
jgi:hypothetical protein